MSRRPGTAGKGRVCSAAALVLAAALSLVPAWPARALERRISVAFTKEILYTLASDNLGEKNKEMADGITGLTPGLTSIIIKREADALIFLMSTATEEAGTINFTLNFDKMDIYKLAVAREDVTGILPIMERVKVRSKYLRKADYRFDPRRIYLDLSLDVDRFLIENRPEEAKRLLAPKPEPPKPSPPPPEPIRAVAQAPPVVDKPAPVVERDGFLVRKVTKAPVLDGRLDDAVWSGASPIRVDTKGPKGSVLVFLTAVHDEQNMYLALAWTDSSKSDSHKPWVWDASRNDYLSAAKFEDAVAVQISDRDLPGCMTNGREYQADLWVWGAARTDPSGFAEDETVTVSAKKIDRANAYPDSAGGSVWIRIQPDEGDLPYRTEIPATRMEDERARFFPQKPTQSMADVRAKGLWEFGRWTVEISRKLNTGNKDDLPLAPRKTYSFNIAVFNEAEWMDHSVSRTVTLTLE